MRKLLRLRVVMSACLGVAGLMLGLNLLHASDSSIRHHQQRDAETDLRSASISAPIDLSLASHDLSMSSRDLSQGSHENVQALKNFSLDVASGVSKLKLAKLSSLWNSSLRYRLSLPGVFTYLPHLTSRHDWLTPNYYLSKGRENVSFVIGVPTIKRPASLYVLDTLTSLFNSMNSSEQNETVVVVCVAEPWDESFTKDLVSQIQTRFPTELESGLLEVISPRPEFYPDLSKLRLSLGDSRERVKWRSKQNLDYSFLILHSWSKARYYLQLEDDVKAEPGFISSMKKTIARNHQDWFTLEFSTLGFIGRLFRSDDAVKMMEFLLMFFDSKPCDWLYDDFMQVKMCGHGEKWNKCMQKIRNVARSVKPSLFQHEGLHSSLQGNLNKLKDKAFGISPPETIFNAPTDTIITTINSYEAHEILSAYNGNDFFWGISPAQGDIIDFLFTDATVLTGVTIVSGNSEHPQDILTNATVEVLPDVPPPEESDLQKKKIISGSTPQEKSVYVERISSNPYLKNLAANDTFFCVGEFDSNGVASLEIPREIGKIWIVRVRVLSPITHWIIIRKIAFKTKVE